MSLKNNPVAYYHLPSASPPLPPLPPSLPPSFHILLSLGLCCLTHSLSSTLSWITSPSTRSTDSFLSTPALSGCSAGVFEILARCGGQRLRDFYHPNTTSRQ
ncbi:hypothetical protein EYF80_023556 [Liparis tanakae]|uniref:Uncharacterized protein n=1 Tax=Liparis tanakae TaxID=230148 RepID=A0A4Z2HKB5_9TELE|nr:hypothetical protein EYF80_023556 [Liparis tanakae]